MAVLSNLKPASVFKYFEAICSVPHGSGNTKQVSDLCASFAKKMGLKYVQDDINNLIIYKPASKGMEEHETVILQGHMDMVCAKTADCKKDMTKEGLDLIVEGDHIRAKDTSLGGDDGIAVAMILAVLEDKELVHPAIEAVFTVDEEVGMDGAAALDMSLLKGRRMLNLDSEEEGVFTVSCAGGLRMDCEIPCRTERDNRNEMIDPKDKCDAKDSVDPKDRIDPQDKSDAEDEYDLLYKRGPQDKNDRQEVLYNVSISGLIGGHSGTEIDKGRGNAIKLMSRFLYRVSKKCGQLKLVDIFGGEFDNVICNRCDAVISVDTGSASELEKIADETDRIFKEEFATTDPGISLKVSKKEDDSFSDAISSEDTIKVIDSLFLIPNGIAAMSSDIRDLVETSSNIGVVRKDENGVRFTVSVRSSVASRKYALRDRIEAAVTGFGGNVSIRGEYPGWAYRKDSPVRDTLSRVYKKQTGKDPVITAIHAGLECGLFSEALKGLDCVSIGPELKDIHSVGEKLGIASVERMYELVTEFLAEI